MSRPRSFRLDASLLAALQSRAREAGETVSAVAQRYLDEGLRMDRHPLVVFRDGAGGRRPALAGTRLDVAHVIETLRASENSISETAGYLGIPDTHVRAAVRYYAEFQDEVDEWLERMRAANAREEEAWQREQSVLA